MKVAYIAGPYRDKTVNGIHTMKRKKGLTLEQHVTMGKELRDIYSQILGTYCLLSRSYPHNHKAVRVTYKIYQNLIHLRSLLDTEVCRENKNKTIGELIQIYFGDSPPRFGEDIVK